MLMTSGYNLEGYDIMEYVEHASAQLVLGTGFFSSLNASISDIFGITSNAYEDKLNLAEQVAKRRLIQKAYSKNCNAVIGIDVDYTTFSNDVMGVIVSGTLVKVAKQVSDKKSKFYINSSYNLSSKLRVLESTLTSIGEDKIYISISGKKYISEEIKAVETNLIVTNIFNETYEVKNIMFADIDNAMDSFATEYVQLENISAKDYKLVKSIKVQILKYVLYDSVFEVDIQQEKEPEVSENILKSIRMQQRNDAVRKAYRDKNFWHCCCGTDNALDSGECIYCKQSVDISSLKYVLEENASEQVDLTELITAIVINSNTAKEIYDNIENIEFDEAVIYNEMFPRLKRMKDNERLYGNSKQDAIQMMKNYFPFL